MTNLRGNIVVILLFLTGCSTSPVFYLHQKNIHDNIKFRVGLEPCDSESPYGFLYIKNEPRVNYCLSNLDHVANIYVSDKSEKFCVEEKLSFGEFVTDTGHTFTEHYRLPKVCMEVKYKIPNKFKNECVSKLTRTPHKTRRPF